jgi:hypothetical protein
VATWPDLAQRFATTLEHLRDEEHLIVSADDGTPGYVQFRREANQLFAEAASDHFVPGANTDALCDFWEFPMDMQENWGRVFLLPLSAEELAELGEACAAALRDAYGIGSPDVLVYTAWRHPDPTPPGGVPDGVELDPGDPALQLPALGLRREQAS